MAETIEVFSSSANDTAAGTGARTVRLIGLDENGDVQTDDVTLNGTTAVETTTLWYRNPRVVVLTAGSTGANEGTITTRHSTTTANVFNVMPVGANQSTIAADTVPAGHTGYLIRYRATAIDNNASIAVMSLRTREPSQVYRQRRIFGIASGEYHDAVLYGGLPLPSLTDIKFRCESVTSNDMDLTASFDVIIVKDV